MFRGEAGIVANDQALVGHASVVEVIGQALRAVPYVAEGEVISDDTAPAVSAESDCRLHILSFPYRYGCF